MEERRGEVMKVPDRIRNLGGEGAIVSRQKPWSRQLGMRQELQLFRETLL